MGNIILFAVLAVVVGLFVSFYISLPSGATIVVSSLVLFILSLSLKINEKRVI